MALNDPFPHERGRISYLQSDFVYDRSRKLQATRKDITDENMFTTRVAVGHL